MSSLFVILLGEAMRRGPENYDATELMLLATASVAALLLLGILVNSAF